MLIACLFSLGLFCVCVYCILGCEISYFLSFYSSFSLLGFSGVYAYLYNWDAHVYPMYVQAYSC